MAKYMVDIASQRIVGGFSDPFTGTLAGKFMIDVPDSLGVVPATDLPADLYAAKRAALIAKYPGMAGAVFSEDIGTILDSGMSDFFVSRTGKGSGFMPGSPAGTLVTSVLNIPVAITQVLVHWSAYTATRVRSQDGSPDRILYNFDPNSQEFFEFDPSSFSVDLIDSAGEGSLLSVEPDVVTPFSFGPNDFRLSFLNEEVGTPYLFSDFYLLYG